MKPLTSKNPFSDINIKKSLNTQATSPEAHNPTSIAYTYGIEYNKSPTKPIEISHHNIGNNMINNYQRKSSTIKAIQYNNNIDAILKWLKNKAIYSNDTLTIFNPEGNQIAKHNDYIINLSNEFYVCKPSEFNQLYQQLND